MLHPIGFLAATTHYCRQCGNQAFLFRQYVLGLALGGDVRHRANAMQDSHTLRILHQRQHQSKDASPKCRSFERQIVKGGRNETLADLKLRVGYQIFARCVLLGVRWRCTSIKPGSKWLCLVCIGDSRSKRCVHCYPTKMHNKQNKA